LAKVVNGRAMKEEILIVKRVEKKRIRRKKECKALGKELN